MPWAASMPLITCTTLLVAGSTTWMLSPALFVMYTRTVSADAGNAASASANHACLKRKRLDSLEPMAVLLPRTQRASVGGSAPQGQGLRRAVEGATWTALGRAT